MAKLNPIKKYARHGKSLLHEIRINPTHKQIDEFYRQFRLDLKLALECDDVEKVGAEYHLTNNNQDACGIYLPAKRWFTLQDITKSKKVFKAYRDYIAKYAATSKVNMEPDYFTKSQPNWNDINRFKRIIRKMKIKKADLMAHLIFAAWKHDNINIYLGDANFKQKGVTKKWKKI